MKIENKNTEIEWPRPNSQVLLDETEIEISVRGQLHQVRANASLRLLPEPRVVIACDGPTAGFGLSQDFGKSIKLVPTGTIIDVNLTSSSFGGEKFVSTFAPHREPITVSKKTRQRLSSVQFSLINFPEFFRGQDVIHHEGHGGQCLGAARLTAGPVAN